MKPEEQRIAIAKAHIGVTLANRFNDDSLLNATDEQLAALRQLGCATPNNCAWVEHLPDYLTDLNAMHEAEKALPKDMKTDYVRHLNKGDFANYRIAFATAAQRAEAFLKTLNLWTTHPTKGPK